MWRVAQRDREWGGGSELRVWRGGSSILGDFDSQPLCQPDLQQTPTLCTQFACTFCALASALFLAPLLHPFRLGSLSLWCSASWYSCLHPKLPLDLFREAIPESQQHLQIIINICNLSPVLLRAMHHTRCFVCPGSTHKKHVRSLIL